MGRVWRAADEMLDRVVAVKEMRIDGHDAEDGRTRRERALREARATARIDHPSVVRIYDVVDGGERLWIVMELVAGRSLERLTAEEGPLGPRETARIGLGLIAALRQVHARGVLHRDIKPGNVLMDDGGRRVVLTDFGIAAIQDAKALTMVGMLVGSPDYMAPERVSGRPQGPPSDVWSLGATLCAALAGHSPFSRDSTLATLHAVLYEEPELPSGAGPLRESLTAALRKEPSLRADLDALEGALRPVAFPAPSPTLPAHPAGTLGAGTDTAGAGGRPGEEPPVPPDRADHGDRTGGAGRARVATERGPAPPTVTRPDPPAPGGSTGSARRRRPARSAAVGVGAVSVAGALVWAAMSAGGAGAPRAGASPPTPAVTAPGTTSSPTATAVSGGPSPTVAGTYRPPSLPPGAHQEAGGYAWATPRGWRRDVKTGAEVHYTSPDGAQELVAKSSLARGDLMETWRTSERNARQGRDYRKIRLEETTFRGRPAVVWEYAFTLGGVPWHAVLQGFTQDGTTYQVNTWYQPAVETSALRTYERVKDSFTVL
ncbi:protein kinase [Streptomyces sp. NPDC101166]|uniref:serine/threonine-protein kinase n=1 Tax=Streptomyces sp. NPDC101166 TaxID=3366120 RepID=UPI0037FE2D26